MKLLVVGVLSATVLLSQDLAETLASEVNVNSRYIVETVDFSNNWNFHLSSSLVEEMQQIVGKRLNTDTLTALAARIRKELRADRVSFKVRRGLVPNHVTVLFDVARPDTGLNLDIPELAYNSKLGWTGTVEFADTFGANRFRAAMLSDVDSTVPRESGVAVSYQRLSLGSDRVRMGFEFDALHDQYSASTVHALLSSSMVSSLSAGAYGSRMSFEPSAAFVLSRPLTLTVGVRFERLQPGFGAHSDSFSTLDTTLSFKSRLEETADRQHEVNASYNLRVAPKFAGAELPYTRHLLQGRYKYVHGRQSAEVALVAGLIYGNAPLFERFVLGNSFTLRGWDKYDLDPLGGNRVAHGSVTYGYRILRVFCDTGTVWDAKSRAEIKESAGVGISTGLGVFRKDALLLALAFPIQQGRAAPAFVAGMNF